MSTENIDDLFRRQLGGHATPPGDELWARLQAGPAAAPASPEPTASATPERVDQLYQHRLGTHATPPPREIWERLEDEHLRPRKRRTAWWPMALAAAVALLLLAGGAGLWRGRVGSGRGAAGTVASQPGDVNRVSDPNHNVVTNGSAALPSGNNVEKSGAQHAGLAANAATKAKANEAAAATDGTAGAGAGAGAAAGTAQDIAQASVAPIFGLAQKNLPARATRSTGPASSASKVGLAVRRPARHPRGAAQAPDVAVAAAPLLARPTAQPHAPTGPADEPAPAVATTNLPASAHTPATEIVPAAPVATAASLAAATLITVDVRHGDARRPSLATAVASAAAAATEERRGLGGRLLRQVGHAVRGERLSLAEVTGLPENLTLEATIAGRRVSKSIQL